MILDRLENWPLYFQPESLAGQAMIWLQSNYDPAVTEGRIPILGDDVFALPQGYATKPLEQARFESHRVYLDIQLVLRGAETMGWAAAPDLDVDVDYNDEKDITWYKPPAVYTPLHVGAGQFAFFHPGDAHAPGLRCEPHGDVFKVVVKVRL